MLYYCPRLFLSRPPLLSSDRPLPLTIMTMVQIHPPRQSSSNDCSVGSSARRHQRSTEGCDRNNMTITVTTIFAHYHLRIHNNLPTEIAAEIPPPRRKNNLSLRCLQTKYIPINFPLSLPISSSSILFRERWIFGL